MSDSYLGEIRMFAGPYAPQNWALCDGSSLRISDYSTLYSLIGVAYGGDGVTTFNLPDLRGRAAIGQGTGQGLTPRTMAEKVGSETVNLAADQIPGHSHPLSAGTAAGAASPANNFSGQIGAGSLYYKMSTPPPTPPPATGVMASAAVSGGGQNAPHPNMMPSLGVNFIICVAQGIFPQQG